MELARFGVEIDPKGAQSGARKVNNAFDSMKNKARGFQDGMKNTVTQMGSSFDKLKNNIFSLKSAFIALAAFKIGKDITSSTRSFGLAISDLSAITGATGDQLDYLRNKSIEFGSTTTLSASQSAEAFKLIASAKPDLLESGEALSKVTKEAITLAEASGVDLSDAAKTLGLSLNQFNASADESTRFINVLAAGAKYGASEVAETGEAVSKSGVVAKGAGLNFEQLNATIQTLAGAGIKGSMAGTQLKGVLLKLSTDTEGYNIKNNGLIGSLEKLKPILNDDAKLVKLFGLENVSAAKILIENSKSVGELTKKLTGSNTAYEQQEIRTENLHSDILALGSAYERLSITIGEGSEGSMRSAVQYFTELTLSTADTIENFRSLKDVGLGEAFQETNEGLSLFTETLGGNTVSVFKDVRYEFENLLENADLFAIALAKTIPISYERMKAATEKIIAAVMISWDSLINNAGDGFAEMIDAVDGFLSKLPLFNKIDFESLKQSLRDVRGETDLVGSLNDEFESIDKNLAAAEDRINTTFDTLADKQIAATRLQKELNGEIAKTPPPVVSSATSETLASPTSESKAEKERAKQLEKEYQNVMNEGRQLTLAMRTEQEAYNDRLNELGILLAEGAIDQETYNRAIAKTTEEFRKGQKEGEGLKSITEDLGLTFASAFEDAIVNGAKFRDLLQGIYDDLKRILARKLIIEPFLKNITEGVSGFNFGGMFGGGNKNTTTTITGANVPVAPPYKTGFELLPGFADGGSFTVGGSGGTDSQLVAFRGSPGEKVSVTKANSNGDKAIIVNVYNQNDSEVSVTETQNQESVNVDVVIAQSFEKQLNKGKFDRSFTGLGVNRTGVRRG